MTTTPTLGQTLIQEGAAGNVALANTLWFWLDATRKGAKDRTDTPPGGPSEGDVYILMGTTTGDWAAQAADDLALYYNSGWVFITPGASFEGFMIWVNDEDELYIWDGSAWGTLSAVAGGIDNLVEDTTPQLGGDLDVNGFNIIGLVQGFGA